MNAEIEHASEHGKAAGEKRPGERKVIGARAAREFREKQQRQAPAPATRPPVVDMPRHSPATAYARSGVLLGGMLAWLFGRRIKR